MSRIWDLLRRTEFAPTEYGSADLRRIPVESVRIRPDWRLFAADDPRGAAAERLRYLRLRLNQVWNPEKVKRLLITSPLPHDGKSTIALNLAVCLAEEGKRNVLLLDGDLHRASLAQLWRTGIESILAGNLWIGEDSLPPLLHALLGQAVLGQAVPGQAVSGQAVPATPAVPPPGGLTRREREIAARIARGLPNKHVAREFSIRERTVKHHLTNIFRKLGISSRLELALLMRDRSPALLSGLLAGADLLSGSDGLC